ncbi:hypothetical protein [Flavobacterium sp.]|jgi:hypothetical protein|uniref:hypothetical protein n=1 Tax=Flavobacterium sp. TaxID=239 RepID=UPI0037C07D0D
MAKEEKINIKNFKDGSSSWWVRDAHYFLNENNELLWAAGESDKTELREALEQFIKRNRKVYVPRSESIFEIEPKEYTEIFNFGKYSGKKVTDFQDTKYLKWLLKNFNFGGKEKLKKEIEDILKN